MDPSSIVPGIDEEIIKEFWDVFEKHADNCTVLQIYEQKERIIYVLFDKEKFEFFEKEITRAKREKVLSALKIIRSPFISEDTCYGVLEQVLDDILPESLKEGLGNIKTKELFVIPHSWLHQIPWEAVVVDEKPLCIKYNLIRHYSLDLLRSSLKYDEKENKNALLVSNPKPSKKQDLPGAEIECSTINEVLAKLSYNPTHLNRESARIEDIENQLSDISIVHFSCHGLFNTEDPFESSIILSSDKELSANKISLKNLDYYPLVFLNACESGITKSDESTAGVGDEQIGLVRAFAMAHSPSIIVTGWEIDVDVAEYFAKQFYGALYDNNLIDALTSAREKTHKKFVDKSKDWAAYVLYGNPYRKL
jgi:CHAT domain-containing protein